MNLVFLMNYAVTEEQTKPPACSYHFAKVLTLNCLFLVLTIIVEIPAEHLFQIVKNIMKKCRHTNTNWRLGLLEYLCTPFSEKLASPAELLAGRQFKGLQPTLHAKLTPNSSFSEQAKEQLVSKKEIEKSQHDKSAHDLQILTIGSTVMCYDHKSKYWLVGRVTEHQHDRVSIPD